MRVSSKTKWIAGGVFVIACFATTLAVLTLAWGPPPLEEEVHPPTGPHHGAENIETPWGNSAHGEYRFAAVASDAHVCSQIGTDVLGRLQGSAVDAAIATMICVGVVNCHSAGIGGGHFMTIYDTPRGEEKKVITTFISREVAPAAADRDMFINDTQASTIGGLAVGVPGEVMGLYRAWQKFGRQDWADLVRPSIRLCREGHIVPHSLANAIQSSEKYIRNDANLREVFVKPNGDLYQEGDIIKHPKLGKTLEIIAEDPLSFYNGSLAHDIVADLKEYGGNITFEDLSNYKTKEKDALHVELTNGHYDIYGPPPPSSGVIFQFILNILDGYNWTGDSIIDQEKEQLTYHRIVEAFKFAYAKRSALGDEDYVNVSSLLANLTSNTQAELYRLLINDTHTQDVEYYGPEFQIPEDHGTAHFSVLAQDGSAVSLTSTINLYFGSKSMGSRTGIIFNNEMDDFSTPGTVNSYGIPASPSNFITPGKMPMSSMCPSIVLNREGKVVLLAGASGGSLITSATAFVAINNLMFKKKLNDSVNAARIHHQLVPDYVKYEPHIEKFLIEGLEERGHVTVNANGSLAVVQAIHNHCAEEGDWPPGKTCIYAVSDGRKGGAPDGF